MQKYPYRRVLLDFPLLSHLLTNLLEWYLQHDNLAYDSFTDWFLNTNTKLFLYFTLPALLIACWCCQPKCTRWQIKFPLATFIIALLYSLTLRLVMDYAQLETIALILVYPLTMMIYTFIALQWLLPKKGFQAA